MGNVPLFFGASVSISSIAIRVLLYFTSTVVLPRPAFVDFQTA